MKCYQMPRLGTHFFPNVEHLNVPEICTWHPEWNKAWNNWRIKRRLQYLQHLQIEYQIHIYIYTHINCIYIYICVCVNSSILRYIYLWWENCKTWPPWWIQFVKVGKDYAINRYANSWTNAPLCPQTSREKFPPKFRPNINMFENRTSLGPIDGSI